MSPFFQLIIATKSVLSQIFFVFTSLFKRKAGKYFKLGRWGYMQN